LSRRAAGRAAPLKPLRREAHVARLRREQPYALARADWSEFERGVRDLPAYELRRTDHPDLAVQRLRSLLEQAPMAV
jgi:hypothetical protein